MGSLLVFVIVLGRSFVPICHSMVLSGIGVKKYVDRWDDGRKHWPTLSPKG